MIKFFFEQTFIENFITSGCREFRKERVGKLSIFSRWKSFKAQYSISGFEQLKLKRHLMVLLFFQINTKWFA